jgi:hypothetical protein
MPFGMTAREPQPLPFVCQPRAEWDGLEEGLSNRGRGNFELMECFYTQGPANALSEPWSWRGEAVLT